MSLKTASIFFSKEHFQHPDYIIKKMKVVSIPPKELSRIKKISAIVACFTFGVGGVLCYYIWTASKKVELLNLKSKAAFSGFKTDEVMKDKMSSQRAKRAQNLNIQTVSPNIKDQELLLIKKLKAQIEVDPGYHNDWKNVENAKLHANLMAAPENSYCIIPLENNEYRILSKRRGKESDQFYIQIVNFSLKAEGLMVNEDPVYKKSLAECLKSYNLDKRIPLKELDANLVTKMETKVEIGTLKRQIEEDPGFSKKYIGYIYDEHPVGTYAISVMPNDIDSRDNLYCLTIKTSSRSCSTSYFWITNHGIIDHICYSHKNGEEAALFKTPPQVFFGNLKEFLSQTKNAITPFAG